MSVAAPPVNQPVSRGQILALGQSGEPDAPWRFVPLAETALAHHADDLEMRFFLSAAYARLGLRTPAIETLAPMLPFAGEHPQVAALASACQSLPPDRVPDDQLLVQCRANVVALAERGVELFDALEAWRAGLAQREFFHARGSDAEPEWLIRDNVAGASRAWRWWNATRAEARRVVAEIAKAEVPVSGVQRPVVIEGVSPPWLLLAIARAFPPAPDGSCAGIRVLQLDPGELLDGLAMAELRSLILDGRTSWFVGETASERLSGWLDARDTTLVDGLSIVAPGTLRRSPVSPAAIVSGASQRQVENVFAVSRRVRERQSGRTLAWWASRFEAACPSDDPIPRADPLRVLLPTYRMSTYVRHATADLSSALESLGVRTRVLMEPDEASRLSRLAYIRAVDEFDPDLVVSMNYTRRALNSGGSNAPLTFEPALPLVTWVQDPMPHLFRGQSGSSLGPFDFVMGHAHPALFSDFSYPRERFLPFGMAVSAAEFQAPPAGSWDTERFDCEVAFVTHHAETPTRLFDRLVADARSTPGLEPVLRAAYPLALELAERPLELVSSPIIAESADRLLEAHRIHAGPEHRAVMCNQVLRPLIDRILRHRVLEWAAELCEQRSWRLHIYGRGWDRHPSLGRYARGGVEHGEELRAAYQLARVNLHVSAAANMHQRIMECALSGGLPIALLKKEDLHTLEAAASLAVSRDCTPWCSEIATRRPFVNPADHPAAAQFLALQQRLGVPARHEADFDPRFLHALTEQGVLAGIAWQSAWLMGDPSRTCFWDRASFERVVRDAVESPRFRQNAREGIARRVRADFTLERIAHQMLQMVRRELRRAADAEVRAPAAR